MCEHHWRRDPTLVLPCGLMGQNRLGTLPIHPMVFALKECNVLNYPNQSCTMASNRHLIEKIFQLKSNPLYVQCMAPV